MSDGRKTFIGSLHNYYAQRMCTENSVQKNAAIADRCYQDLSHCDTEVVEKHLQFDLGFVEFTERGNQFDRARTKQVIDHINQYAQSDKGAAVFVFVHGWKHNAASDDSNVINFREMLSRAAENLFVGQRRVIGLYLGLRGKVTSLPFLKELSYWGRKSVAEEIGAGGATEVLTELNQILIEQFNDVQSVAALYKNTYVIIGHSFGGAIVLSALHDVVLAELIAVSRRPINLNQAQCHKVKRFADGVVLLNPAIEANRLILLRDIAAKCEFGKDQPPLMHIISSETDLATSRYFPIGQYANLAMPVSPKKLNRSINGKRLILDERELDVTTTGNLDQLRTGYLFFNKNNGQWVYKNCRTDLLGCGLASQRQQTNHIPVAEFDPLLFIRSDADFIQDHNDVFSCYTQSYITTIMFKTQAADRAYIDESDSEAIDPIANYDHSNFDFSRCFNNQLYDYNCEVPN
jgi:hypothetical protein